jgi:tetratricopeptide (TPR) repeat protein
MDANLKSALNCNSRRLFLIAIIIGLISFALYLPTLEHDFLNMDDMNNIVNNPNMSVPDLDFIKWMFGSFYKAIWHPLTWFSFSVDYALWEHDPRGFHLTNIILHALNSLLVVLLFNKLFLISSVCSGSRALLASAFIGLLFGVHPLHVESVAWVTERKDVLYSFFWLLSLIAYVNYTLSIKSTRTRVYFGLCLLSFGMSLMSKPMAVTLPAVLLILDWYPLKRIVSRKEIIRITVYEKLPFYVLSLASSIIAVFAHGSRLSAFNLETHPMWKRFFIMIKGYGFYLKKIILPLDLVPFYPLPDHINPFSIEYAGALVVVALLTIICFGYIKRMPLLLASIIQMNYTAAADRFMYLPMLGPLALVGAVIIKFLGVPALTNRRLYVYSLLFSILFICISLVTLTKRQFHVWKNSLTLWGYVIEKYPENSRPYMARFSYSMDNGNLMMAIDDISKIIEINAKNPSKRSLDAEKYHVIRASLYFKTKQYDKCIEDYSAAINQDPGKYDYYYNRAISYSKLGKLKEAFADYQSTVLINPDFAPAYNNMGKLNALKGDYDNALRNYSIAISRDNDNGKYYYNRARIYELLSDKERAVLDYKKSDLLGDLRARKKLDSKGIDW